MALPDERRLVAFREIQTYGERTENSALAHSQANVRPRGAGSWRHRHLLLRPAQLQETWCLRLRGRNEIFSKDTSVRLASTASDQLTEASPMVGRKNQRDRRTSSCAVGTRNYVCSSRRPRYRHSSRTLCMGGAITSFIEVTAWSNPCINTEPRQLRS